MKKIAYVILLSAVASSAFAEDRVFYVGGNVGQVYTRYPASSRTGTAITLLGGYQINDAIAVEAQYGNLGSFSPTATTKANTTAYSVTAVGNWPFSEQWAGYIKLGLARTATKFDAGAVQASAYTANRIKPTGGIGGQYDVNQALGIRFGYDVYGIGDNTAGTAKTEVTSAGVIYKF